jgi:sterol 24-C-methyltransferase
MSGLLSALRGLARQPAAPAVALHESRYAPGARVDAGEGAARYYDLVTDFYEYGWGPSFHFAPRRRGESLADSLVRLEHDVARRLCLTPGQRVLDAGCGVGGPMRSVARQTQASIEGVTINAHQVARANALSAEQRLAHLCRAVHADFRSLPHADHSFDAAMTFEALCHAEDRAAVLREIARVVRPGGLVAGTDWCLTGTFDAGRPEHRRIREGVERGNGLAPLLTIAAFERAIRDAGLELVHGEDLAADRGPGTVPWYRPLQGGWRTPTELRRNRAGRALTHLAVRLLEAVRLAPAGSLAVSAILNGAADSLVEAGEVGLVTPLYLFVARVPERAR